MGKVDSSKHARKKHARPKGGGKHAAPAAAVTTEESPFIREWDDNTIAVPRKKRSRKRIAFAAMAAVMAVAALVTLGVFHPDIRSRIVNTVATFGLDTSAAPAHTKETATHSSSSSDAKDEKEALAHESSSEPAIPPLDLPTADFSAIPSDTTLAAFSLNPAASSPTIDLDARIAIDSAVGAITQDNECAFVFVDLVSGKGYSLNADQEFYTASSFKAPYAFYLLQRADNGAELSESDRDNIHASITYSDNDAYDSLHYKYDNQEFYDWLETHGITQDPAYGWYPNTSPKKMASLWCEMFQYVMAGSENARWLQETTSNTSTSFIRTGLEESGASVWNKGGWITDYDVSAVCDAGIIRSQDGRDYLMVIMTDQPDGGASYERIAALTQALFFARNSLV